MATGAALIRSVQRKLYDKGAVVFAITSLTADATAVSLTLTPGDGAKIPKAGVYIESDDYATNNQVESCLVIGSASDVLTLRRATGDADYLYAHAANIFWRVSPRFSVARCLEEMQNVVNAKLWPHVWIPRETTLVYQGTNEYFSPTISDLEQIDYVYQLVGGRVEHLNFQWIHPGLADNTNFPNGAVIIRQPVDGSTIYVAGRALPKGPNEGGNTRQIENLMVIGTAQLLALGEEMSYVGPDRSAAESRLSGGDRIRNSVVLRGEFEEQRTIEHARLEGQLQQLMQFYRGA